MTKSHANFLGRALRPPFAPSVLEVADEFLLLGVDRDRGLTRRERFFHPIVDVVELRIAIGVSDPSRALRLAGKRQSSLCRSSATSVRPIAWPISPKLWLT